MQTAGSGWQICAQMHDRLGESVLWHPEEEALYWIDFYGPSVHRKQWNGGPVETWQIDRSGTIGSFVLPMKGALSSRSTMDCISSTPKALSHKIRLSLARRCNRRIVRGKDRVDDRRVISGILHVLKSGCRTILLGAAPILFFLPLPVGSPTLLVVSALVALPAEGQPAWPIP